MAREPDPFGLAIRQVLLDDWDPTSSSRVEAAHEEYDRYIPPLADLIRSNVPAEAIVDYLYDREREILCFPGLGKQRLRRVAQRLKALHSM